MKYKFAWILVPSPPFGLFPTSVRIEFGIHVDVWMSFEQGYAGSVLSSSLEFSNRELNAVLWSKFLALVPIAILSRLFLLTYFVKCKRTLVNFNSKGPYSNSKSEINFDKTGKGIYKKNPCLLNLLFFKPSRCRPVVESYKIKPLMAEG